MKKTTSLRNVSAPLAAAFSLIAAAGASAATVASYGFTGGSFASGDTDVVTTAGDFTGTPAPSTAVTNRLAFSAFNSPTTWSEPTGYASFTLTPGASPISLAALTFDYGYQNVINGGNYALQVFSSLTGFTGTGDAIYSSIPVNDAGSINTNIAPTQRVIDLSANAAFENITTPVEFRFYFTDGHSGTTRYHLLDNVVLSTVPEPSALLLGAVGCAAAFARRKRI